jgi:hypothetical protein
MSPFQADSQNPLTLASILVYQNLKSGNFEVNDVLAGHAENLCLCQSILKQLRQSTKVSPSRPTSDNEKCTKKAILLTQKKMAK